MNCNKFRIFLPLENLSKYYQSIMTCTYRFLFFPLATCKSPSARRTRRSLHCCTDQPSLPAACPPPSSIHSTQITQRSIQRTRYPRRPPPGQHRAAVRAFWSPSWNWIEEGSHQRRSGQESSARARRPTAAAGSTPRRFWTASPSTGASSCSRSPMSLQP